MRPNWLIRLRKKDFYYGMAAIVGISLIISCLRMNTEHIFLCVPALLLFMLPHVLNRWLKLYIPLAMEIVIVAFIVCGIILGEVENFFVCFPYWDTIMHTVNGIVCAALSLSLVVLLNEQDKILFRLSPVFLMLVAVSFSMLIGVLWEFFEFGIDRMMKKVFAAMYSKKHKGFIFSILIGTQEHNKKEISHICRQLFFVFAPREKALLRLTSKKANLEDVFIELTEEDIARPGAEDGKEAEREAGENSTEEKVVVNALDKDVTIYWIVQSDKEDDVIENLLTPACGRIKGLL